MALKYTPERLAAMKPLFYSVEEGEPLNLMWELEQEARLAGVLDEALANGLTLGQWSIVRNQYNENRIAALRDAVLSAD